MEHTYIEQFEKEFNDVFEYICLENKDVIISGVPLWNLKPILKAFILKVRTETLMECRGLIEKNWDEVHDCYMINKDDFRTAIDTLIKKETI